MVQYITYPKSAANKGLDVFRCFDPFGYPNLFIKIVTINVVILLMAISSYSTGGYWWLLMIILLMVINDY
jgi:hypothetical protein